jgi:hypothetical protein
MAREPDQLQNFKAQANLALGALSLAMISPGNDLLLHAVRLKFASSITQDLTIEITDPDPLYSTRRHTQAIVGTDFYVKFEAGEMLKAGNTLTVGVTNTGTPAILGKATLEYRPKTHEMPS